MSGQMHTFERYATGPQSVSIRSARKSTNARTFGAKCRLFAKTVWIGVLGGTKGKSSSSGTRCSCFSASRIIQVGSMMIPNAAKAILRKKTRLFALRRPDMGTLSVPCGSSKPQWFLLSLVRNERQLCASSSPGWLGVPCFVT